MERDERLGPAAASIGALEDDLRRQMYLFIRRAGRPVGRDEAAQVAGISRKLAAFHLDKLVEKGLLVTHYARPPERSGPGAGRTAKYYEPSSEQIDVSFPPREYDTVGEILVDAIMASDDGSPPRATATKISFEKGRSLGEEFRTRSRLRPAGTERALSIAEGILGEQGYEPYRDDGGGIRLRNCPFHDLSRRAPELVCGLNQAFVDGLLRGLGNESLVAELDPLPGECCVRLHSGAS
jgi:predicted ArsR family transcriptional regulator